jgi:tetratricopeptide (TPR) repeat protein
MSAEAHYNLGAVLERDGQLDEAMAQYARSVELDPSYVDANFSLGLLYETRGDQAHAAERFRRVLQIDPASTRAQTQLAWLLATSSDEAIWNPNMAVTLAEQAVANTSGRDAMALDVLAAALASTGEFDRAVKTQERTLAALGSEADPGTVAAARSRLALYRERKMYRTGPGAERVVHP